MEKIFKEFLRAIITFCIFSYCKIVYRIKVIGLENIPKDGPLLFCGNHRTYLDAPLIVVTSPRRMYFMAKDELRKNLGMRILCYVYDGIWVKRDSKDIGPLKTALKALKDGKCVGIFPEGTRNGMEKNDGKLKNGASYMAIKTNAKIIPIGIIGPAKPFTKNAIIYGKPIDTSNYISTKIDKNVEEKLTEDLKEQIIMLTNHKI